MKFYELSKPDGYEGSSAQLGGGCGSDGAMFDLVPDNFVGVNVSEPCKIHDYRYGIGGTEKDRDVADREFRSNLRCCVLNNHNLVTRCTNLWLCELYYIAVHRYGMSSFNYQVQNQEK